MITNTRPYRTFSFHCYSDPPPKRKARTARGKSDQIDALAAARTVLPTDIAMLSRPRAEGLRAGLRILLAARRSMNTGRTADRNALNALVRSTALGIDARKALTDKQIIQITSWLQRDTDDIAMTIARDEARRLATAVIRADEELKANHATLARLVTELCSNLQDLTGVGPVTGATVLAAYSHHGRVRSEAAFAALAGVKPIPASSGNTVRHRLNRRGDRQLNEALDIIARVRISCDAETRVYVDKRTNEGKTSREIRRSLKRYIARQIYRTLHATA